MSGPDAPPVHSCVHVCCMWGACRGTTPSTELCHKEGDRPGAATQLRAPGHVMQLPPKPRVPGLLSRTCTRVVWLRFALPGCQRGRWEAEPLQTRFCSGCAGCGVALLWGPLCLCLQPKWGLACSGAEGLPLVFGFLSFGGWAMAPACRPLLPRHVPSPKLDCNSMLVVADHVSTHSFTSVLCRFLGSRVC